MEGREVERHVRPQLVDHPAGHRVQLAVGIVLARDEQGGDLEPDVRLVLEIAQGVEHGSQLAAADPAVEVLGEPLEVDVGGVHVAEEFLPRRGTDLAGRHGHGL